MERIFPVITENEKIAENVYRMRLRGDFSSVTAPGQFVNFAVDGCYLRRPISVCDVEGNVLTVIYKVVGKGTEIMSKLPVGKKIDTLSGLGNGYDVAAGGDRPLLIGGGVGVPPLYKLCKDLIKRGARPIAALGFNTVRSVLRRGIQGAGRGNVPCYGGRQPRRERLRYRRDEKSFLYVFLRLRAGSDVPRGGKNGKNGRGIQF